MNKNPILRRFVWGVAFFVGVFVNFPIIALNLPRIHRPIVQLDLVLQIVFSVGYVLIFIQWLYHATQRKASFGRLWGVSVLVLALYSIGLTLANYFLIGLPFHTASTVVTRGVLMAVITYFFSRFMTETARKNEILLENEQLKHENLLVQLNSLKNQLNPHFLFNSLNTLSWLINEDKAKSQRYLQKLSQVLRYSLNMQEQSLVPLQEELDLVENYVFLLQMRFVDNLKITQKIPRTEGFVIPPLSVQLLIENAVKHNVISSGTPLSIHLELLENRQALQVSNSLHPKAQSSGTGIGLVNLNQRFKLLMDREIEITQEDTFKVVLPLMKP